MTETQTHSTTHRVGIAGMHCQSCVQRIERALRKTDGVHDATVSLESETAEVTAASDVTQGQIAEAIAGAGDYRMREPAAQGINAPKTTDAAASDENPESLYPLFLIVGYIAGAVLLIAAARGAFALEPMMRHFMAGFFLVFSFFKLLDIRGFVSAYRGYDLIARAWSPWAWAYPFVELALGVAYLVNLAPAATNTVTLILMLIGAAGVLKALMDRKAIRCACLGTALNLPMTKVTLVEDLTMAAMAGGMLVAISM